MGHFVSRVKHILQRDSVSFAMRSGCMPPTLIFGFLYILLESEILQSFKVTGLMIVALFFGEMSSESFCLKFPRVSYFEKPPSC
jgi:hypothetical protein